MHSGADLAVVALAVEVLVVVVALVVTVAVLVVATVVVVDGLQITLGLASPGQALVANQVPHSISSLSHRPIRPQNRARQRLHNSSLNLPLLPLTLGTLAKRPLSPALTQPPPQGRPCLPHPQPAFRPLPR